MEKKGRVCVQRLRDWGGVVMRGPARTPRKLQCRALCIIFQL